MTGSRLLARVAAATAVLGVTVLSQAAPASAHAVLLGTAPADGSAVTTVMTEVTLTFNEPVHAPFGTVAVNGPDGVAYSDGELTVLDNVVHQRVYPLRSGDYQVAWRVVSADGHPISGTFAFSVSLPAGLEPTVTPPAPPAATTGGAESGWPLWWWAPVGVAAAVVALLLVRAGGRRVP